jgi:hypothetical protein
VLLLLILLPLVLGGDLLLVLVRVLRWGLAIFAVLDDGVEVLGEVFLVQESGVEGDGSPGDQGREEDDDGEDGEHDTRDVADGTVEVTSSLALVDVVTEGGRKDSIDDNLNDKLDL